MKDKVCITNSGELLNIGDIITGYRPGIFRIVNIKYSLQKGRPDYDHWLVEMDSILDGKYKPRKCREECDSGYCRKMTIERALKEHKEAQEKLDEGFQNLKRILE